MGFMDLVLVWDLKAYHLPRIESPFIAASMARRLVQNDGHVPSHLASALGASTRDSHELAEAVYQAVSECRLMLVHTGSDRPLSPLVTWQPDGSLLAGARWRVSGSGMSSLYGIKKAVAELNDCGVTQEQLRQYRPQGVGGLGVGLFSANYRQWRQSEREAQGGAEYHRLTLPLGASAPLNAAAASATEETQAAPFPRVHLEVGVFTDGTMNNAANARSFAEQLERDCLIPYENDEISREECEWRLSMLMGGSYANAVSNVAKLWDLYPENELESDGIITYRRTAYAPGAGTKTGDSDVLYGAATGMGEAGVIQQVKHAFAQLALRLREDLQGRAIDRLTLDLFGFSRGAAAARHAAHEINLGKSGLLAKILLENGILWPEHVEIRFVGVFDSVAAIVNPLAGDLLAHNDRNHPVKLYLDPGKVGQAVHLTAAHEHRKNFALNSIRNRDGSLPANFREITLPGAHSDIGGGYGDSQREEVLLSPMLQIPRNRMRWPERTSQWDNLEVQRQQVVSEGWVGPYNLPVQQSDQLQARPNDLGSEGPASLEIVTRSHEHPAPDGRIELVLRMLRQVRGDYSRVPLRLMHRLAVEQQVPLGKIDPTEETVSVPDELEPVLQQILGQIGQGSDSPSLVREHQELLLQRYIHYSAHYNGIETLLAGDPSKFEGIYPHAPVPSGERLVYPQMKGE
ncbi:DUF2235 domain-containing protein [Marinobacter sp. TBZ242]|uniref:DUF2235 domain-containing protein n=1 Tax=Marinobacter azerbaijanicus TaxID=3050455 RepID=A0ABT7IAQ8_9GAMM|nr:DUF2235 domain-containing protein [Marinobacter sp. TBZ242]MDL0431244.1 DUF2235 domain-containing protein [Marinobacter sp. TBZ242]